MKQNFHTSLTKQNLIDTTAAYDIDLFLLLPSCSISSGMPHDCTPFSSLCRSSIIPKKCSLLNAEMMMLTFQ